MKILLINPPIYHSHPFLNIQEPLGLAYLAAFLRSHKYEVKILDAISSGKREREINQYRYGLNGQELYQKILKIKPDIVGITCLFSRSQEMALRTAEIVKKTNKKIITVLGGAHPTLFPQEVLENGSVDFVIMGEGEESFLNLVRCIESQKSVGKNLIDGCAYKSGQEVKINPKKSFIQNLDDLSFPARDLLPMEFYLKSKNIFFGLGSKRACSILTSRSCPNYCSFCASHLLQGRGFRPRSAENVFEEIKYLVRVYGVQELFIIDDNFTLDKNRAAKICELILKNNLKINWNTPNGIHINTLDEELLTLMKRAGCRNICLGIESGDEITRQKIIGKNISTEKISEVAEICRKINLPAIGFFILGFPGETANSFLNTVKLIKNLPLDMISIVFALPLPGSNLYEESVAKGYLDENHYLEIMKNNKLNYDAPIIETEFFSKDGLKRWRKRLYLEFLKSHFPRLLIKTIFFQNTLLKPQQIMRFLVEQVIKI